MNKNELLQLGGQIVGMVKGAFNSDYSTTIEVILLNDTFYYFREISTRLISDAMGIWCNSEEVGQWAKIGDNLMTLDVPEDNKTRVIIPFNPDEEFKYQINGVWNYCCECNQTSKCCMAWPQGQLGFICTPCPFDACQACIAVPTDEFGGVTGGPAYIFYHSQLTQENFVIGG